MISPLHRQHSVSSPRGRQLTELQNSFLLTGAPPADGLATSIAEALGYLIAFGSVLLYTPIAVRILRQKSADGLTVSTWWLKLTSYTCSGVYNIKLGYPISSFAETLVIAVEAAIVLALVTFYQRRFDLATLAITCVYLSVAVWALASPPDWPYGPTSEQIALGQGASATLNTIALLPQLQQNFRRKTAGDYSAITASLASVGCAARLFTTVQLAGGDPLLLWSFGTALVLNASLLGQILWFGTQEEGRSVSSLFLADVKNSQ